MSWFECGAVIKGNLGFSVSLFTALHGFFSHVLIENTNVNCSREVNMPFNLMLYQPTAVIRTINISACMTYLWKQSNKMEYTGKKKYAICIYISTCQTHYS